MCSLVSDSATPWTSCSPAGPSVHGILQARVLGWIVISSSRDLPDPGSPALAGRSFTIVPPGKPWTRGKEVKWGKRQANPENTQVWLPLRCPVPGCSHTCQCCSWLSRSLLSLRVTHLPTGCPVEALLMFYSCRFLLKLNLLGNGHNILRGERGVARHLDFAAIESI